MITSINGEQYEFSRSKLRKWIELDALREQINTAVGTKDITVLGELICTFVSAAVGINIEKVKSFDWKDTVGLFNDAIEVNDIDRNIPLFRYNEKQNDLIWDYPNRSWYVWAHRFAKIFGWSLEYIAELDVDDAFKLLQEALVDEQLEREWQWGLSEKSSGYDEVAKKGRFIELPRPAWMRPEYKEPKPIQIPVSLLPVGMVIRYEPDKRPKDV